jgi:hypothetical protein
VIFRQTLLRNNDNKLKIFIRNAQKETSKDANERLLSFFNISTIKENERD